MFSLDTIRGPRSPGIGGGETREEEESLLRILPTRAGCLGGMGGFSRVWLSKADNRGHSVGAGEEASVGERPGQVEESGDSAGVKPGQGIAIGIGLPDV